MISLEELLKNGTAELAECGVTDAATDAWLLMEYVFQINRGRYFLVMKKEADPVRVEEYCALIQERKKRIPLQHLTHQAFFMGEEYYVDHRVLIPRQDTEILVEKALSELLPGMRILDLCTGSGCILLSILLNGRKKNVSGVGSDLSAEAIEVALLNKTRLGVSEADFLQGSLFENIREKFDMIVSNPPYIPTGVIEELEPEVRDHDPMLALDGRADGLGFYREITKNAGAYLKENGMLLFEIGYDQGSAVKELMLQENFSDVEIVKDYAGLDRVVCGRWARN